MSDKKEPPDLLDVPKAAIFLNVKSHTIRRWATIGKLNGIKVNSRGDWRFSRMELAIMKRTEKKKFIKIKLFLREHAEEIKRLATRKHKEFFITKTADSNKVENYKNDYMKVIIEIADNLENLKKGTKVFKKLGEQLAKKAIENHLTLEEAIDGTIFLKQAFWELLDKKGFLHELSTQDFYDFSHVITTYSDIVASKIAFTYHKFYKDQEKEIAKKQEKLRTEEERYKLVFENVTDIIAIVDGKGRYKYVSPSYQRILGYNPKEIIGKSTFDFVHPDDLPLLKNQVKKIKDNGVIGRAIIRKQDKQGNYRYFEWTGKAVFNEGKFLFRISALHDITQQKRVEEYLLYYASLSQAITDAAISTDMNYIIRSFNKGAEKLYGWKEQEILGKCLSDVIPTQLPSDAANKDWKKSIGKNEFWQGEVLQKTKNGTMLHIQASVSLVKDKDGKSIGFVAINRDITDKKKIEQRKDDFIALASHELRTPVTSLKIYTELLERKLKKTNDKDMQNFTAKINIQLDKLNRLVQDLLDVSHLQQGKLEYKKVKFDLDMFISETVEELQRIAFQHKIIIQGNARVKIVGDKVRLRQVITNLVTNAIRYSPKADKIILESFEKDRYVCICVRDFGAGIPRDKQKKIFDRFYQVTATVPRSQKGLGLGLYISQEIVQRHKGQIWVKSEQNKGSTFCFKLPLAHS